MRTKPSQYQLYEEVLHDYGDALERLLRAYEANPDKQDDLRQELHLALWRSLAGYEGRCSLRTWVYRVAHNTAASYVIREHRRRAQEWVSLEHAESVQDPQILQERPDHSAALNRLMKLVHSLRPLDRQLVLLYLEELDAPAIGEILGMSPGYVRVQLYRARRILSQRFHGDSSNE